MRSEQPPLAAVAFNVCCQRHFHFRLLRRRRLRPPPPADAFSLPRFPRRQRSKSSRDDGDTPIYHSGMFRYLYFPAPLIYRRFVETPFARTATLLPAADARYFAACFLPFLRARVCCRYACRYAQSRRALPQLPFFHAGIFIR